MKTTIEATASSINAARETYFGDKARAWVSNCGTYGRIYFGKDFVTIDESGAHNTSARARAKTIGDSAVEMVERHMAEVTK